MHCPIELTKRLSPFRNLSQVHSNRLFKHCNRMTSASIVLIKPQAFWCHGGSGPHECWNACASLPRWGCEPLIGGIAHAFLETQFLSNQFQNELMMIYKRGIWFLLIVCQTLHCSVAPLFFYWLTRRTGGVRNNFCSQNILVLVTKVNGLVLEFTILIIGLGSLIFKKSLFKD